MIDGCRERWASITRMPVDPRAGDRDDRRLLLDAGGSDRSAARERDAEEKDETEAEHAHGSSLLSCSKHELDG
jgi:hypothetical protein